MAGFIYGMTGDNDLDEIESCWSGNKLMYDEINAAIANIKKGGMSNDIQAGLEFGLVVCQFPQALSTCKNMDDDISAIENWAKIFENPVELSATVTKHYALHHNKIQGDFAKMKTDFANGNYFNSGKDLADLAVVAVGPIQ